MLLLKRHLVDLVRSGKSRQTIRLWTKAHLKAGQITYTPGLGKLLITAVDTLPSLAALTEQDALADGFPSLSALLEEIHRIYGPPPIPTTRKIFRIQFHWPLAPLPANPAPAPLKKSIPTPTRAKSKKSTTTMSPTQRQSLRTLILSRAPRSP